jgi:hypothetical protein
MTTDCTKKPNLSETHNYGRLLLGSFHDINESCCPCCCPCSRKSRLFNHFKAWSILGMPFIPTGIYSVGNPKHMKEYMISTKEPKKRDGTKTFCLENATLHRKVKKTQEVTIFPPKNEMDTTITPKSTSNTSVVCTMTHPSHSSSQLSSSSSSSCSSSII